MGGGIGSYVGAAVVGLIAFLIFALVGGSDAESVKLSAFVGLFVFVAILRFLKDGN